MLILHVTFIHFGFFFLNIVTDIKETATAVNFTLMKLIALQDENEEGDLRPSLGRLL